MSQLSDVCRVLKAILKQQQITYKLLAQQLSMSEANVKRMFSTQQFSLERLEEICIVVGLELSDLFLMVDKQKERLMQLSKAQEQELVDDSKLLLVAACARDGWDFEEIIDYYQIDKFECIQLMAKLDRLKMIQLLPNNQYKMLIAQDFTWIPNGPLERHLEKAITSEFMASSFTQEDAFRFYIRGAYSQSSISIIRRKLEQFKKEVALLNQEDAALPLDKRQHVGLVLAMRPWEINQFKHLKR